MLSFEEIKELIELVNRGRLRSLEIERSGFRLRIDGQDTRPAAPAAVARAEPEAVVPTLQPASTAAAPVAEEGAEEEAGEGLPAGAHVVNSPIVGTYYSSSSPDADPYVQVGDRVKKGQVLCIVEAMKLMNEIESDVSGKILEIYPRNAQPVEFGDPLFAVQPD